VVVSHQSPQPVQDESEAAPESRRGILQANQRRISAGARGIPGENVPRRVEGPLTFLGQQALS
jgi:hypothetical protein